MAGNATVAAASALGFPQMQTARAQTAHSDSGKRSTVPASLRDARSDTASIGSPRLRKSYEEEAPT